MRTASYQDGHSWLYAVKVERASLVSAVEDLFPDEGAGMAIGADGQVVVVPDGRPSAVKFLESLSVLEAVHARIDASEDEICESVRARWVAATPLREAARRAWKTAVRVPRQAPSLARSVLDHASEVVADRIARRSLRRPLPPDPYGGYEEWGAFRREAVRDLDEAARLVVAWLREAQLAAVAAGVDPSQDPWPTVAGLLDEWRVAVRRDPLDRSMSLCHGHVAVRYEWTRDRHCPEMTFVWPGLLGAALPAVVDDPVACAVAVGASDILVQGEQAYLVANRSILPLPLSERGRATIERLKGIMGLKEDGHIRPDAVPGLEATAGLRCARTNMREGARYSFRFLARQGNHGLGRPDVVERRRAVAS